MARDIYQTTMTQRDAVSGALKPLQGIEISLWAAGTYGTGGQASVPIYQADTGAATGPSPATDATPGGANVLVTGVTGAVEFFANVGYYDVHIRDTQVPIRIAERTIKWNATSGAAGGTPTSTVAADGGLPLGSAAADLLRQAVPIGGVIDWWRPSSAVVVPAGYEICDGHVVAAGSHDFGIAGAVNLPDLRNKFIMGADVLKTDAVPSTNGDGTAIPTAQHPNAPGIGGAGGSNTTKNLDHQHIVLGHKHVVTDPGHGHAVTISDPGHGHGASASVSDGGHGHDVSTFHFNPQGGYTSWGNQWETVGTANGNTDYAVLGFRGSAYTSVATGKAYGAGTGIGVSVGVSGSGTGISASTNAPGTGITVGSGAAPDGNSNVNTSGSNLSAAADMRPQHVGLLKIMKVRRS